MGATPSTNAYVREWAAGELTKLGVSYLPVLAGPSTLARVWSGVPIGYSITSFLPSVFPPDNIRDIILREPPAFAF